MSTNRNAHCRPHPHAWIFALALLPLAPGCNRSAGSQAPGDPGGTVASGAAQVSIASANLIRPCEAETPASVAYADGTPPAGVSADMERRASCGESSLQIVIEAADGGSAVVAIESVVLKRDGQKKAVTRIAASEPTLWNNETGSYAAWDGTTLAGAESMASFVLTPEAGESFPDGVDVRGDLTLHITIKVGPTTEVIEYKIPAIIDNDMVVT